MTYLAKEPKNKRVVQCDFTEYVNSGIDDFIVAYLINVDLMDLQPKDGYEIKIWGSFASNSDVKKLVLASGGDIATFGNIGTIQTTTTASGSTGWTALLKVVKVNSTYFVQINDLHTQSQSSIAQAGVAYTHTGFSYNVLSDCYIGIRDYTSPNTAAGNIIVKGMTVTLIPG